MAKRKHREEQEMPFVALMDTMTNVVGVLIIVLVMVGLGIATTVKRVLSELPPVTKEQLAQLIKEMAQPKTPETPESVQKKIDEALAQVKKLTEELKTIDLSDEQQKVKFMDLDEIRKKIERAKYDRDKEKKTLDALFAELDRLKKALDDTPVFKAPPPKYVRIPNPRPVPQGAVRENFLLSKGRVLYLNDRSFLDIVQKEIVKQRPQLLTPDHPKITSTTPPASIKYSKEKMLAYFDRARIGDRSLTAKVTTVVNSPTFYLSLTPADNVGETPEDLRNPASFFQRFLRKIKAEPGKIAWFFVTRDSVDTYLVAREVADSIGVPVGWQIYGQNFYVIPVPGVTYAPFTPPPEDPNRLKIQIATPKDQID